MDTPTLRAADTAAIPAPKHPPRGPSLRPAGRSSGELILPPSALPTGPLRPPLSVTCPKCEARLLNPFARCVGCGFRRPPEAPAVTTTRPEPLGMVGAAQAATNDPGWLLVLVGGGVASALCCIALDQVLPNPGVERSTWGMTLLLASLAVIGLCQLWVLVKLIPTNDYLELRDLVDIPGMWSLALRNLPETRWQIWLATWAVVIAVCSVAVIGGQKDWVLRQAPADAAEEPQARQIQPATQPTAAPQNRARR